MSRVFVSHCDVHCQISNRSVNTTIYEEYFKAKMIVSSLSNWTSVYETPVEDIWIEPTFLVQALSSDSSPDDEDRTPYFNLMALPGGVKDDFDDKINSNDLSKCQDETRTPAEPTFSLLPNGRRKKASSLE